MLFFKDYKALASTAACDYVINSKLYIPSNLATLFSVAFFLIFFSNSNLAQERELRFEIQDCSQIKLPDQRLKCYDSLVIVEKEITLNSEPNLELGEKYLKHKKVKKQQVELLLTSVAKDKNGRWNFQFENGQLWRQLESNYLSKPKNLPQQVTITQGIFGSHKLRFKNNNKIIAVSRIK